LYLTFRASYTSFPLFYIHQEAVFINSPRTGISPCMVW